MLLAVDIGNSNIKFGIFDGEQLLSKFSIPTNKELTSNDLRTSISGGHKITNAAVCSVVPDKERLLTDLLRDDLGIDTLIVNNDLDLGLEINYHPRSAIGTDRLVNSFAAVEKYGAPCIVCSFGTATTFDVVDRNRKLLGGTIAPGMKTMTKALHLSTAKLPEVDLTKPERVIGNTTVDAIQSGIFYGHIAMAEGMIQRFKNEVDDELTVIATGGFAVLIAENSEQINVVDMDLTLDGLSRLYRRLPAGGVI